MNRCIMCGRVLKNPKQIEKGYGECCFKNYKSHIEKNYKLGKWLNKN